MFRPITIVCDGCRNHFEGINNGYTRDGEYRREDIEAVLRTEGWQVPQPAGAGSEMGIHICPECVRRRSGNLRVVDRLGETERNAIWRDSRGEEFHWQDNEWWQDQGPLGPGYRDYTCVDDDDVAAHPPYTEVVT